MGLFFDRLTYLSLNFQYLSFIRFIERFVFRKFSSLISNSELDSKSGVRVVHDDPGSDGDPKCRRSQQLDVHPLQFTTQVNKKLTYSCIPFIGSPIIGRF